MKIFSNIVIVVFAVYLSFVFDCYVVFGNTEMIINEFLSFSEERYLYSDIRAIEVERLLAYGNAARIETHYVIEFTNGKRWYSRLGPDELDDAHFRKIMEFVAKRSSVPISNPP